MDEGEAAKLRAFLSGLVQDHKLPHVSLVVSRHNKVEFSHCAGPPWPGSSDTVSLTTISRFYSMTKPIVSACAVILAGRGILALDDPVSKHVREWDDAGVRVACTNADKVVVGSEPANAPITLRHLLTHTSGLDYHIWGPAESSVSCLYRREGVCVPHPFAPNPELAPGVSPFPVSAHDFVSRLAKLPLAFHPGARFQYGCNTDLLGVVVERVVGKPLADVVDELVLGPLAMRDTHFVLPEHKLPRLSTCCHYGLNRELEGAAAHPTPAQLFAPNPTLGIGVNDGRCAWLPNAPQSGFASAGGGLLSTPHDYLRFAQMLANHGELDGVRVLTPAQVVLLKADQLAPMGAERTSLAALFPGFGLGLSDGVLGRVDRRSAGGWGGIAGTYFVSDWDANLCFVLETQMVGHQELTPELRPNVVGMVYNLFPDLQRPDHDVVVVQGFTG